jgi:hypothetical protein
MHKVWVSNTDLENYQSHYQVRVGYIGFFFNVFFPLFPIINMLRILGLISYLNEVLIVWASY